MAFDTITLNSGSGGSVLATDTFTDTDAAEKVMPYGGVAFGALNGPYTPVTTTDGFPVQPQTGSTWVVSNAGTFAVQAAQSGTWTVTGAGGSFPVTDSGGSLTVDGTVAATQSGTWSVQAQDGSGNALASDVGPGGTAIAQGVRGLVTRAVLYGYNAAGPEYAQIACDGSGILTVAVSSLSDGGGSITVDDGGSTISMDDGGGSLTVDGSVSVSGLVPGVSATSLGKAEDAVAADGDTGVMMLAVRKDTPATTVGAAGDYHPLEVDANGRLWTSSTIDAALPAGTNAIGKLAANTGVTIGAVEIAAAQTLGTVTTLTGSGVAHDAADSGNPHKIGAKATTALSGVTLVADADRTDLRAGIDGVLITRPYCNLEDIVTATPVAITDGSSTSVIAAQGAGVKVYITEVAIANSSASNVTVDLRDGTAGSVKWTFPVPANGGVVKTFATPLPFSANTAVAADPSAAASTITVSLLGFKSKV